MRKVDEECRINGLQIREVMVKTGEPLLLESNPGKTELTNIYSMEVMYATAEVTEKENVLTHGKCTAGTGLWSKNTWGALKELLDSMETDLIPQHFKTQEKAHERIKSGGLGEETNQI